MEPRAVQNVRIAGILDELSAVMFPRECNFCNLDIDQWQSEIETFQPELLFVESAWKGKDNKWYRKIFNPCKELTEILDWCKCHGVKTVFWNKEDPVHFTTFLKTASLFDWVFTTDFDCIPLYKHVLKHDQVGVLPFATCLSLFNPIHTYERKDRICFAGAYYMRQQERTEDFRKIFEICSKYYPVDIYARNPYPGNIYYTYPAYYQKSIIGSLPMEQIEKAYKGYKYGITVNTVKRSTTMESRRIFEMGSCNTRIISNSCKGVRTIFGDLVLYFEDVASFDKQIEQLEVEDEKWYKCSVIVLRKMIREHTYKKRIEYLFQKVLQKDITPQEPSVVLYSVVSTEQEESYVKACFKKQKYENKILVTLKKQQRNNKSIVDYAKADYYTYISPNNYYGKNYITDLIIATEYVQAPIIGKGHGGTENEYVYEDEIQSDRCIVHSSIIKDYTVKEVIKKLGCFYGIKGFVCDHLNFYEGYTEDACEQVDDLVIDQGMSINEIYKMADELTENSRISIQRVITPLRLFVSLNRKKEQQVRYDIDQEKRLIIHIGQVKLSQQYLDTNLYMDVEEFRRDDSIKVYYRGKIEGTAKCLVKYVDQEGKFLKSYNIPVNSYQVLPIPKFADRFCITFLMGRNAVITVEEIGINVEIKYDQ